MDYQQTIPPLCEIHIADDATVIDSRKMVTTGRAAIIIFRKFIVLSRLDIFVMIIIILEIYKPIR